MKTAFYRVISGRQAKTIDIKAREKLGISTLVLMENAGRAVSSEAYKSLGYKKKKVILFCGKGNNGGDGFVAARHLLTFGIKPEIFLIGKITDVVNEAGVNLGILLKLKQKVIEINQDNLDLTRKALTKCDLVIDALFGVGLSGELKGFYRGLVEAINVSRAYVLSVDIPSGLDANTGRVLGYCVKADKTVTFVARKVGMTIAEGPKYCGKTIVADLGIPQP